MKTLLIIILAITVTSCTKSVEKPETKQQKVHKIINAKKIS